MKKAATIYRGKNPLLENLNKELQGDLTTSVSVDSEKIEIVDPYIKSFKLTDEGIRHIKEKLAGKNINYVITDSSLNRSLCTILPEIGIPKENIRNVYDIIARGNVIFQGETKAKRWVDDIVKAVNFLHEKRRTVVIDPFGLSDHINDLHVSSLENRLSQNTIQEIQEKTGYMGEREESDILGYSFKYKIKIGNSSDARYVAGLIGGINNIEVINEKDFSIDRYKHETTFEGNLIAALKNMGITGLGNTTVLVDHHVYDLGSEQVSESGFNKVNIFPVCPCCMFYDQQHDSLKSRGFKLEKNEFLTGPYLPELVEIIKKKIQE